MTEQLETSMTFEEKQQQMLHSVSKRIIKERENRRWTRRDLAENSKVGLRTIERIESKSKPCKGVSIDLIWRVSNVLGFEFRFDKSGVNNIENAIFVIDMGDRTYDEKCRLIKYLEAFRNYQE